MVKYKISHIKEIISNLSSEFRGIKNKQNQDLRKIWNSISGNASKHSYPLQLKRKKLIIGVDSSCWLYILNLSKSEILLNLNKILDQQIEDIKFIIR